MFDMKDLELKGLQGEKALKRARNEGDQAVVLAGVVLLVFVLLELIGLFSGVLLGTKVFAVTSFFLLALLINPAILVMVAVGVGIPDLLQNFIPGSKEIETAGAVKFAGTVVYGLTAAIFPGMMFDTWEWPLAYFLILAVLLFAVMSGIVQSIPSDKSNTEKKEKKK